MIISTAHPTRKRLFPLNQQSETAVSFWETAVSFWEMAVSANGNHYFRKWKRIFPPIFSKPLGYQGFEGNF